MHASDHVYSQRFHTLCCFLWLLGAPTVPLVLGEDAWPQFRGPDGQGHASARDLPLTWSEKENVAWKTPIPGLGWSSPVLRGEQLWLTTAVEDPQSKTLSLRALCLDPATGRVVYDVEVFAGIKPGRLHPTNSQATPTPILEEGRVYVHFGSYGTACLFTEGKVVWKTQLEHALAYGPSSTPVVYADLLIVPCHGTDVRYTAALEKTSGRVRWKQGHQGRNSDATPLVIETPTGPQLVCNFAERVVSLDPRTGKELWFVQQGDNYAQVPRPVLGHGLVFVAGGYFSPVLQAIRIDGSGDVTRTHIAWSLRQGVPQNPSPLLVGDELYLITDKGIASCLDARTGKLHWRERLEGEFYASPLLAGGRLYFTNVEGGTTVVAPTTSFKKLAENRVEGRTLASLAAAGKVFYLRTDHYLYRIQQK